MEEASPPPLEQALPECEEQKSDLLKVLEKLFAELRESKAAFENNSDNSRAAVVLSLQAVLRFLIRFQYPVDAEGLQVPLGHLHTALLSLEDGTVLPLLRKSRPKQRGRSNESGARHDLWGLAAHFLDLLSRIRTVDEAARAVADLLAKSGFGPSRENQDLNNTGGRARITNITVLNWHRRVNKKQIKKERCQLIYQDLRRHRRFEPPSKMPEGKKWSALLCTLETILSEGGYDKLLDQSSLTSSAFEKPDDAVPREQRSGSRK
jgi:hypothetical protein